MPSSAKVQPPDDLAKLRRSPNALSSWQRAMQDLKNGRHAPALAAYRSLIQQFPGIPQLWGELGLAALGGLEFAQAEQAFQRAVELAPFDPVLLVFIGWQFYHLRRLDQAFDCMKRAVAADLSSAAARLALAAWLERSRRLDEALECIGTGLVGHPKNADVLYFRAFLLHRKGKEGEAETALRDLLKTESLPTNVQADANHLLGEVLDALGQYAEALACLGKAKAIRRKIEDTPRMEQYYEKMERARRELLAQLTPETLRRWRGEADASPCPHPLAFLGGAARSGTTLIEQILGAHPEVLIFDETFSFGKEVVDALHPPPARPLTLQALNDIPPSLRAQMTARYLKSLLRETEENPGHRLLLDKNPGTTAWLHVWLRFFPQSKVIIALRDPRDVVISCYFQNFPLKWSIVGFLSLEGTAKYYSDMMDEWLRFRELGGFDWIETRYEDVVGNLEEEGRRLTNCLGLPWHEAQATYYETARKKFVHSPTYSEVTKPVYSRAVGRWKHYQEAMAPLQEGLAKYCQAFGYG